MDNKYTILNITNEKILNLMVNVLFYFSIPLVGVSFLRIPKMGFLPVMYLHVALALVVSINYLFRKRFNFNLKATVILFTFILIGIGGALTNNRVVKY